jgi:hypothetical protein
VDIPLTSNVLQAVSCKARLDLGWVSSRLGSVWAGRVVLRLRSTIHDSRSHLRCAVQVLVHGSIHDQRISTRQAVVVASVTSHLFSSTYVTSLCLSLADDRLFDVLTGSSSPPSQVSIHVPSAFALSRARIRNFEHTSPVQAIQDPISTRVDLSIDTTLLYPPSLYHRHVRHPCLGP